MNSARNRLARRLANFVLKVIGTRQYSTMIEGAIRYGLNSAARDTVEGRDPPRPWQEYAPKDSPFESPRIAVAYPEEEVQ